jgi:NADPH:quinone reductase
MKAIVIDRFGGPEVVRVADVPVPPIEKGRLQIKVDAAGLNPADWKCREGWLQRYHQPAFPYVLGFDLAGTVSGVGEGCEGFKVGDRVVAKTEVARGGAGSFAAFTSVPLHFAVHLPAHISITAAASIPVAGITAWEATFAVGKLEAGQTILVNGGAGGCGSFAIQIACMAGARVIATSGPANLDYVKALGAAHAIDYRSEDVAKAVAKICPEGVDLVLDTVGQGVLPQGVHIAKRGGRVVTIGTLVAGEPQPDAAVAAERNVTVATAMSSREREGAQLQLLVDALAAGKIKAPFIDVLPVSRAGDGLERLKTGHVKGKIVVTLAERDWE